MRRPDSSVKHLPALLRAREASRTDAHHERSGSASELRLHALASQACELAPGPADVRLTLPLPNPAAVMHDRRGNQCPVSHFQQTRTFPKRHSPS